MNTVLSRVFAMPFNFSLQLRAGEGRREQNLAIALNALDYLLRRGLHIRPAAMVGKFKLVAMVGDGFSHPVRRLSAVRKRRGGKNAAHDDAGEKMPRLRLQANLDGHIIRADFVQ